METNVEAALMFADVSGSTKLYDTVGDKLAFAAVGRCVALMSKVTGDFGGRVVKTIGDEVMSVFQDANSAASAAMEMQNGIEAMEPIHGARLAIRIGLHFGPVVERDNDYFGDTVNLAARLSDLAIKGQIITSRATVDKLNAMLRGHCRQLYGIGVKGKAAEVEICEIMWRDTDDATTQVAQRPSSAPPPTVLKLKYRAIEVTLDGSRRSITLGREKSAELVVEDPNASRNHGQIELRGGRFMLVDHSANGTYLTIDGDREHVLRRDEYPLRGRGWIALGQSKATATEFVEYHCE
jgi:adenylate cyclase